MLQKSFLTDPVLCRAGDSNLCSGAQVREFICSLPRHALLADVGCGNGKYFGVRPDLALLASDRSPNLAEAAADRCLLQIWLLRARSCPTPDSLPLLWLILAPATHKLLVFPCPLVCHRQQHFCALPGPPIVSCMAPSPMSHVHRLAWD